MRGSIERHEFPLPQGGVRVEFSWKLFLNGRCVARSEDYFPHEHEAASALDAFLEAAPKAPVVGPCKTCAGWKPSPSNAATITCKDCGRSV